MERKWLKRVQALQELKRTGRKSAFKKELNQLKKDVFRVLCEKRYKTVCDPAYCALRYTKTCRYLKVWNSIEKQLGL